MLTPPDRRRAVAGGYAESRQQVSGRSAWVWDAQWDAQWDTEWDRKWDEP